MIFDELSETGLRSAVSETLTERDDGSQVQFAVPSGDFVFLRFSGLRAAMHISSDNLDVSTPPR
jgi:hypothetical protein